MADSNRNDATAFNLESDRLWEDMLDRVMGITPAARRDDVVRDPWVTVETRTYAVNRTRTGGPEMGSADYYYDVSISYAPYEAGPKDSYAKFDTGVPGWWTWKNMLHGDWFAYAERMTVFYNAVVGLPDGAYAEAPSSAVARMYKELDGADAGFAGAAAKALLQDLDSIVQDFKVLSDGVQNKQNWHHIIFAARDSVIGFFNLLNDSIGKDGRNPADLINVAISEINKVRSSQNSGREFTISYPQNGNVGPAEFTYNTASRESLQKVDTDLKQRWLSIIHDRLDIPAKNALTTLGGQFKDYETRLTRLVPPGNETPYRPGGDGDKSGPDKDDLPGADGGGSGGPDIDSLGGPDVGPDSQIGGSQNDVDIPEIENPNLPDPGGAGPGNGSSGLPDLDDYQLPDLPDYQLPDSPDYQLPDYQSPSLSPFPSLPSAMLPNYGIGQGMSSSGGLGKWSSAAATSDDQADSALLPTEIAADGVDGLQAGAAAAAGLGNGGMPFMPPMGGAPGAGGQQDRDRERTTWLAEDEDVWGTDPDCAPAVIGRSTVSPETRPAPDRAAPARTPARQAPGTTQRTRRA